MTAAGPKEQRIAVLSPTGRDAELTCKVLTEAAIRKLDYHPNHVARSLKSKQTKTLGMVISDITNPFFPLMVRGAEDAASARGYFLITFNTDDRIERERVERHDSTCM